MHIRRWLAAASLALCMSCIYTNEPISYPCHAATHPIHACTYICNHGTWLCLWHHHKSVITIQVFAIPFLPIKYIWPINLHMFLLVVVSIRPLLERLLLPVVECTYPHAAALYVRWMIGLVDDDIGLQMQRASTSTQVNIEVILKKVVSSYTVLVIKSRHNAFNLVLLEKETHQDSNDRVGWCW